MKLSRASALGVFATVHLANAEETPIGGGEIAKALGVPVDSLMRVLQSLTKAGVLRSTRGRGGGFSLARSSQEISLLCIVEAVDGPLRGGMEGSEGLSSHGDSRSKVEAALEEASSFAKRLLKSTSVADLITHPEYTENITLEEGSSPA